MPFTIVGCLSIEIILFVHISNLHKTLDDIQGDNSSMTEETTGQTFPQCYQGCNTVKLLGAGECESVCPHKFKKGGDNTMTTTKLTITLPAKLHQQFRAACEQNDTDMAAMIRVWVRWWLELNEVYQEQQGGK